MYERYFSHRSMTPDIHQEFHLPRCLRRVLPANKQAQILDIGCGLGYMLMALRAEGYANVFGVDASDEAANMCEANGLWVRKVDDLRSYCLAADQQYDFIIMSHVLEHLEKAAIIEHLRLIKTCLLRPGAAFWVAVPNAQSSTGCYWAYEDFTHQTMFTAGSLLFVLKEAGFAQVELLDTDGLEDSKPLVRPFKKALLALYRTNLKFWQRVTVTSFHRSSPIILSFEIKAVAR